MRTFNSNSKDYIRLCLEEPLLTNLTAAATQVVSDVHLYLWSLVN